MLLEIGIGDAYGRAFEFNTPEFIAQNNDPARGYSHRENESPTGTGTYTDDTQMSIGIALHMLSKNPAATAPHYAHRFMSVYKRDPHAGYSRRVRTALETSENVVQFLENVKSKGASSNGSVMRTIPLGLMKDPQDVIHHCIAHTTATHCSVDAINATIAVALTAHYFVHYPSPMKIVNSDVPVDRYDNFKEWLCAWMGDSVAEDILSAYLDTPATGVPCDARLTASWGIHLGWQEDYYSSILKQAVAVGGDVDSIAAISLGLASLNHPHAPYQGPCNDLPSILYSNLENGRFGRDYLERLDSELMKAYLGDQDFRFIHKYEKQL